MYINYSTTGQLVLPMDIEVLIPEHHLCRIVDSQIVNEQLKEICSSDQNFAFVSAKGLTDNGDCLYFNAKSLREFGIRQCFGGMQSTYGRSFRIG